MLDEMNATAARISERFMPVGRSETVSQDVLTGRSSVSPPHLIGG